MKRVRQASNFIRITGHPCIMVKKKKKKKEKSANTISGQEGEKYDLRTFPVEGLWTPGCCGGSAIHETLAVPVAKNFVSPLYPAHFFMLDFGFESWHFNGDF